MCQLKKHKLRPQTYVYRKRYFQLLLQSWSLHHCRLPNGVTAKKDCGESQQHSCLENWLACPFSSNCPALVHAYEESVRSAGEEKMLAKLTLLVLHVNSCDSRVHGAILVTDGDDEAVRTWEEKRTLGAVQGEGESQKRLETEEKRESDGRESKNERKKV